MFLLTNILATDAYKVDFTPAAEMVEDGYSGLIQKATNGGTQFEMLVNTTGNYYFNEIWCSTSTECWVVASGQNETLRAFIAHRSAAVAVR